MGSKLTPGQTDWLRHAQQMGYENGFVATPIPSLVALERLNLIERDPTSSGKSTHWRVTEMGLAVDLGQPARRWRRSTKPSSM